MVLRASLLNRSLRPSPAGTSLALGFEHGAQITETLPSCNDWSHDYRGLHQRWTRSGDV
jgi:hypothetical protein